jgi:hypothetical protein
MSSSTSILSVDEQ